jgi:hypothetical protein
MTDTEPTESVNLPELINEFAWRGVVVNIEETALPVLTIMHPRHGEMHFMLRSGTAQRMRDWLVLVTTPQQPPN